LTLLLIFHAHIKRNLKIWSKKRRRKDSTCYHLSYKLYINKPYFLFH